ncbi:MAG TPA: right-handed parallel beta-helix repeat-containing protein [Mycobacteriales bacterium]|nr:right-handed parallel beta-helix repeat-containing protein [Mycobacteriales bacterium]
MTGSRGPRAAGLLLAGCLVLSGCSGGADPSATPTPDTEADCAAAVDTLLGTAQRYLDSIGTTTTRGSSTPSPTADPVEAEAEFTAALSNVRAHAASIGCDPRAFRDDLTAGLRELRAGGPVAQAVLLQLQGGQAPEGPVPPGGDVAAAVAVAPADAVVELAAGEHVVDETLVLLRGVTLRGAGRDATTLRSTAADGVVLVLTGEPVTLDALGLTRGSDVPGNVVSAAPSAELTVSAARLSGARGDAEGRGGIGLLMSAGAGGQAGPSRRTSLRLVDSELVDNAVGGVVVAGEHRAEIARTIVTRSGQCGICFLATSDGTVSDTRLVDNEAGLVTAGEARPAVRALTVQGGDVGVQALERSSPTVDGSTVSGVLRAAFLFGDRSTGAVRGTTCTGAAAGIVVGPEAVPEIGENPGCGVVRGQ